jgi:hypothetical protein
MTVRIYLAAARLLPGPPESTDLPAERVFIHASEVPEIWVETEHTSQQTTGRQVSFALAHPLGIGFERVTGTVERAIDKRSKERIDTPATW